MNSSTAIERLCALLRSPQFCQPLSYFLDTRSCQFTSDGHEENAHEHHSCHVEFQAEVERLLAALLPRFSLTEAQFLEASASLFRGEAHDEDKLQLVDSLLACQDFVAFKSLMFARNLALEADALHQLQRQTMSPRPSARTSSSSQRTTQAEREIEDDILLKRVIELSLRDAEMQRMQAQREAAELELAIAMSLALDKQKREQQDRSDAVIASITTSIASPIQASKSHAEEKEQSQAQLNATSLSFHQPDSTASSSSQASCDALPAIRSKRSSGGSIASFSLGRIAIDDTSAQKIIQPLLAPSSSSSHASASIIPSKLLQEELAKRKVFLKQQRDIIIEKRRIEGLGQMPQDEPISESLSVAPVDKSRTAPNPKTVELVDALRRAELGRRDSKK